MKNAAHSKRLFRVFGLLIPPPLNFAEFHTRGGRGPQRGCPGMRPPLGVGTLRAGRAAAPGRKEAPAGTRPGGSEGRGGGPRENPGAAHPGPERRRAPGAGGTPKPGGAGAEPPRKTGTFCPESGLFSGFPGGGREHPGGRGRAARRPRKGPRRGVPGRRARGAGKAPGGEKVCPGRGGAAGRGDCWTAPSGQKATHSKTKTHPAAGGRKAPAANDPGRAAGKPGAFLPI